MSIMAPPGPSRMTLGKRPLYKARNLKTTFSHQVKQPFKRHLLPKIEIIERVTLFLPFLRVHHVQCSKCAMISDYSRCWLGSLNTTLGNIKWNIDTWSQCSRYKSNSTVLEKFLPRALEWKERKKVSKIKSEY